MTIRLVCLLAATWGAFNAVAGEPGNRLVYLDEFANPYYVGLETAKLTTPQWVGEEGVEAVIVLSIDDLRDPKRFETFLRPVIQRLKQIDGRAPISCMGNRLDLEHPLLGQWLAEGLSIEPHTYRHPCPLLQKDDFESAKDTYDRCIDQMFDLDGARPVAFRMPCCDSMNSISPRFFAEVFNKTTPRGNFLRMDSSVFLLLTPDDPSVPPEVLAAEGGRSRFDKYVPRDRGFVNYIENYPYPYVIARLCWEMPSSIPDDWQGHNLQKPHHPVTIADMKAAIDATVSKQGVYVLTHHAGAWIRNDQVIELIDHAVGRYGSKVKFLNFREVHERLAENLLGGQSLRAPCGGDNGVRVLDVNNDGFMDVVIGNRDVRRTRIWSPANQNWTVIDFPASIVEVDADGNRRDAGVRFGVLRPDGHASMLVRNETTAGLWHFDGQQWIEDPQGLKGLERDGPVHTSLAGGDKGARLRDLDGDGVCELIIGGPRRQAVFRWAGRGGWTRLPFALPPETSIVDDQGRDAGLRFVDMDEDGHADVVFSNADRYSLHRFTSTDDGWGHRILGGPRTDGGCIPMIVRGDGTNNGAWFSFRHMWVQNEETGARYTPSQTESRSYEALLGRQ
ncbi:MAG: FG-GAP-like repeat-containing protein [Pirellulaceae bacterium]